MENTKKSKISDIKTRQRAVQILLMIAEQPRRYSKKDLAARFNCSQDVIKDDFQALRNAGLKIQYDTTTFRYYFETTRLSERLNDLLYFSVEDREDLFRAVDALPLADRRKESLRKKLDSVYDYRRLGHAFLREPYLKKIDVLETAKAQKKQVWLRSYRSSSSNTERDRLVEPFDIDPSVDTVQTYDVEGGDIRHFRLSRAERIELTEQPWQFAARHRIRKVDPFRIVADEQVFVRLRLHLGAYNELIERFPAARTCIVETNEKGVFEFQSAVNKQFLGLSNYILGFYHQGIEIVEPDSLRTHLEEIVGEMRF